MEILTFAMMALGFPLRPLSPSRERVDVKVESRSIKTDKASIKKEEK